MRFCLNVKVFQRPTVFENVLRSIRDQETKHEIEIVCALSDEDPHVNQNHLTASKYGCRVVNTPNLPLSTKANMLAKASAEVDFDYLMILGSDDVCGPGFFDAYPNAPEAWGWSDLYLYEPPRTRVAYELSDFEFSERFCYWPGYDPAKRNESIGAGRILRRDVVEQLGWQLHEEGNEDAKTPNLDKRMTTRLKSIGVTVPHGKLPEGVYLVDCKDDVSITKLSSFPQKDLVPMDVPDCLRGYL